MMNNKLRNNFDRHCEEQSDEVALSATKQSSFSVMSICHNVKTEYEALQTLTQEFVSACESAKVSAGGLNKLSAHELIRLQRMKRGLEQARDTLAYKIENKSVRAWKEVWNKATSAVFVRYVNMIPSHQETVLASIHSLAFREEISGRIKDDVHQTSVLHGFSWNAVTGFSAAQGLELLSTDDEIQILEAMRQEVFQKNLLYTLNEMVGEFQVEDLAAWNLVTLYYDARILGLLTENVQNQLRVEMDEKDIKKIISDSITSHIEDALNRNDTTKAWIAVLTFRAALGLQLLRREEILQIQNMIEQERFQAIIVDAISSDCKSESEGGTLDCIRALSAVKDLIQLSRTRL